MRTGTRWIVAVLIGLVSHACGGSGPSGPSGIDVGGTYTAFHSFTVNTIPASCPGSLTLSGSGTFSGMIRVDPCDVFDDQALELPISGTVTPSGIVTITFLGGLSLGDILSQIGCVVTQSDSGFSGTFSNGTIDVTTMASVQSCPDIPGSGDVVWRVEATRQS